LLWQPPNKPFIRPNRPHFLPQPLLQQLVSQQAGCSQQAGSQQVFAQQAGCSQQVASQAGWQQLVSQHCDWQQLPPRPIIRFSRSKP
jgi:hypothetical protein